MSEPSSSATLTDADLRRRTHPFPPVFVVAPTHARKTRALGGAALVAAVLIAASWAWPIF